MERNMSPRKLCDERIKPLLEDVHFAKYAQNGAKVTFNKYAEAIGRTSSVDPCHPDHAEVKKMALSDLEKMIAHHRSTEEAMQKVHASLEEDYAKLIAKQKSSLISRAKSLGTTARNDKKELEDSITGSKNDLREHQAGIFQMMKAREYLSGIKIH